LRCTSIPTVHIDTNIDRHHGPSPSSSLTRGVALPG
jgi:hypothetical protein